MLWHAGSSLACSLQRCHRHLMLGTCDDLTFYCRLFFLPFLSPLLSFFLSFCPPYSSFTKCLIYTPLFLSLFLSFSSFISSCLFFLSTLLFFYYVCIHLLSMHSFTKCLTSKVVSVSVAKKPRLDPKLVRELTQN